MADSDWLRLMASDLDRYAADLEWCAAAELEPGVEALADALDGAATPRLQDDYRAAIREIRAAATLLRDGAAWSRAEAERLAAEEAAAGGEAAAGDGSGPVADPVLAF